MGFGGLLKIKLAEVPGALSFYVLEKFETSSRKIKLPAGDIDVTRESVHQMLGLPMGDVKWDDLQFRDPEDTAHTDWINQFEDNMIRIQPLKMKLVSLIILLLLTHM